MFSGCSFLAAVASPFARPVLICLGLAIAYEESSFFSFLGRWYCSCSRGLHWCQFSFQPIPPGVCSSLSLLAPPMFYFGRSTSGTASVESHILSLRLQFQSTPFLPFFRIPFPPQVNSERPLSGQFDLVSVLSSSTVCDVHPGLPQFYPFRKSLLPEIFPGWILLSFSMSFGACHMAFALQPLCFSSIAFVVLDHTSLLLSRAFGFEFHQR